VVSKEASSATCPSVIIVEEGLDVVVHAILLVGLVLWHHHTNHVGLGHGRIVGQQRGRRRRGMVPEKDWQ
jgi:hypothetical protein